CGPQREQAFGMSGDVVARQAIRSFGRMPPAARDELAEIAVALALGREEHELQAVDQRDLGAYQKREPEFLRGEMRAHDARDRGPPRAPRYDREHGGGSTTSNARRPRTWREVKKNIA